MGSVRSQSGPSIQQEQMEKLDRQGDGQGDGQGEVDARLFQ